MAKLEKRLDGNFDEIVRRIENGIVSGSQAMFFKINTIEEEAFLDKLREIL